MKNVKKVLDFGAPQLTGSVYLGLDVKSGNLIYM